MSDTKVHDAACFLLGVSVASTALILNQPYLYLVSLGSFSGILISPDWDWDGYIVDSFGSKKLVSSTHYTNGKIVKHVYNKVSNRWPHPIKGWIHVYSSIFTHRGRKVGLSHTWLVGTLIRFSWLGLPLLFFLNFNFTFLFLIGLILADSLHLLLDYKIKI